MDKKEWEMIEFLVQFLHPFNIITTSVQATTHPFLHDTWVKYERMFDVLDRIKENFQAMASLPSWLAEVQFGVQKMWDKLRNYYDKTDLPYAFVDATLLHPKLKVGFMTKANCGGINIERYPCISKFGDSPLIDCASKIHCTLDHFIGCIPSNCMVSNRTKRVEIIDFAESLKGDDPTLREIDLK